MNMDETVASLRNAIAEAPVDDCMAHCTRRSMMTWDGFFAEQRFTGSMLKDCTSRRHESFRDCSSLIQLLSISKTYREAQSALHSTVPSRSRVLREGVCKHVPLHS